MMGRIDYASLEKGIKINLNSSYGDLVNFNSNINKPVHRWYYFKEGYSHRLVEELLKLYGICTSDKILDPFCGCGTTLLTSQEKGIKSVGVETNPFLHFIAQTKLQNGHEIDRLYEYKEHIPEAYAPSYIPIPKLSSFKTMFDRRVLNRLLLYKESINELPEYYQNFFLLALSSIVESVSKIKRYGKGLRFVKKRIDSTKNIFSKKIDEMITDTKLRTDHEVLGEVIYGDSRHVKLKKNFFNLAIFSPPYLNSFDYTEVYKLELWLLGYVTKYDEFSKLSRERTIRSHTTINMKEEDGWYTPILNDIVERLSNKKLYNNKIPYMVQAYFNDMYSVFQQLHKTLKNGAQCVFVVGNSSYDGIPIPTDLFLARIAEEIGFTIEEINVARKLYTSSQQMGGYGYPRRYFRESIVVLNN